MMQWHLVSGGGARSVTAVELRQFGLAGPECMEEDRSGTESSIGIGLIGFRVHTDDDTVPKLFLRKDRSTVQTAIFPHRF